MLLHYYYFPRPETGPTPAGKSCSAGDAVRLTIDTPSELKLRHPRYTPLQPATA